MCIQVTLVNTGHIFIHALYTCKHVRIHVHAGYTCKHSTHGAHTHLTHAHTVSTYMHSLCVHVYCALTWACMCTRKGVSVCAHATACKAHSAHTCVHANAQARPAAMYTHVCVQHAAHGASLLTWSVCGHVCTHMCGTCVYMLHIHMCIQCKVCPGALYICTQHTLPCTYMCLHLVSMHTQALVLFQTHVEHMHVLTAHTRVHPVQAVPWSTVHRTHFSTHTCSQQSPM